MDNFSITVVSQLHIIEKVADGLPQVYCYHGFINYTGTLVGPFPRSLATPLYSKFSLCALKTTC